MRRIATTPRPDLAAKIRDAGFVFALDDDGIPYWDETVFYAFTLRQIEDDLEAPTSELAALCVELVERAIDDEALFKRLGLPLRLQSLAKASWRRGEASLYGRFDLSYDGDGPAKLLEYNADTPTSLFEAAVFQWAWLEDGIARGTLPAGADQFNAIHDRLVARWRAIANGPVHFAAMPNVEDESTVSYLAQTAEAAGLGVTLLTMADIGDDGHRFVDLVPRQIDTLFKLYPWEWMVEDRFGSSPAMNATRFVEPAWKAILSTKAILPLLWEMAPGHPNLLPARFSDEPGGPDVGRAFVRKPLRSREGANIAIIADGDIVAATDGPYTGRSVDQALAPLPDHDGNRPVIGSWVVGDAACGIGIRESRGPITTNTSRFVPHAIL